MLTQSKLKKEETIDTYYANVFLKKHLPTRGVVLKVEGLEDLRSVPSESVETVLLDRVLNRTLDYDQVVKETKRVLRSDGKVIAVALATGPAVNGGEQYWGFTGASLRFIFSRHFPQAHFISESFGNALSGRFFLNNRPASELREEELGFADPRLPLVTGIVAKKL